MISVQITEILNQVHNLNIIHKDINPSNIVFNPKTGQVKLIDFGISTVLSRENTSLKNELMANKIQKLPESTQQVLKLAACIGNQFDLETLAVVPKKLPRETVVNLHPAVVEGLVLPLNDGYKVIGNWRTGEIPLLGNEEEFSQLPILTSPIPFEYKFIHDRIQQAASIQVL